MPTYTLSVLMIALLLILGAYVVYQSRRSRESELAIKLRKSEIALHDAEQALQNTLDYYREEVARLQSKLAGEPSADPVVDQKFRRAKSAFARRYHPDRVRGDGPDVQIRTEVFKEFWEELQRIESGR
jgi:hypothetical protein